MSTLPNLLRSLILTSIFSFLAPVLLIGTMLASLTLIELVPKLEPLGRVGVEQIAHFLAVFGSGSAVRGLLIIGIVVSLVGVLFDTYTFYRLHNYRDN
jgi:hypothetical protein